MGSDGFTWSGSLDDTDIQSLYAACQSLRFSGKLELRDGATKAEVTFLGGEPIEIDGGDTQRIALWNRGTFRAVQSIPNLAGELTGQKEMEGSLAITKASQLWAWVSEYRLSCDIDLERPGSKALVTFSNGHAESAQVNGMPELAALARVSSWTDGTFHVRLKPLFVDGVIPAAPLMPEGAPPLGRQFDVSRSIPMDLKIREQQKAQPSFGPARAASAPTPPLGELAQLAPTASLRPPSSPGNGRTDERTSETMPLPPMGKRKSPFDPVELSKPYPRHDATGMVLRPKSKTPWLLSILAILGAAALGALYYYHLPPFSPPPKPLEAALPSGESAAPSGEAAQPSGQAALPSGASAAPSGASAAPSGEAAQPSGVAVAPSGAAVKPEKPEPKPEVKAEKPEPKPEKAPKEKPTDKLVARGRYLMMEGHTHTALEQFRRAQKLAPKDASLKLLEQQAMGKLGRAELVVEGKGGVVVDGYKINAPKKLKVMAGPHVIDAGDGENEVTLKRGEKRRIKVKK